MITSQECRQSAHQSASASFLLFSVGGVIGLFNLLQPVQFGTGFEMVALGHNLAQHGTFANPFASMNTGPTAANPPLYPLLLALIEVIFRLPKLITLIATIGVILANAFTASLLPRMSMVFFADIRPGIIAGILWLLSVQLMPAWDVSYTVALLLSFCLLSASVVNAQPHRLRAILAGVVAGALFLLNPSTILVILPWIAYLLLFSRESAWKSLQRLSVTLVPLILIAVAWMIRNEMQLGAFVVRTNLGMTLYASNNDCAQPSMVENERSNCYQEYHPNTSSAEARLLRDLGEVSYDHLRLASTKAWIQSHPKQFLRLTLARIRDFWFPPLELHPYRVSLVWAATALSIPGLFLMAGHRKAVTVFVLFVSAIYPLMYYIVVSDVRYRYPILWLTLLPAGYFLAHLLPLKRLRIGSHGQAG